MKFDLNSYSNLLEFFKSLDYKFIGFDEIDHASNKKIILRHDIDADMKAACKMAEIEARKGISATYFLMLRSPVYNLLGRENFDLGKRLIDLGHNVALHYDQGYDLKREWTSAQTTQGIHQEAKFLEDAFGTKVTAVSFHQPNAAILQGKVDSGELINTYDKDSFKGYEYISDSNRCFQLEGLDLESRSPDVEHSIPHKLQLLIHPMWWVYSNLKTEDVWDEALMCNFDITQRQLLETERAYGDKRKQLLLRK